MIQDIQSIKMTLTNLSLHSLVENAKFCLMYLLQSNICLSIATSLLQSLVTLEMDAGPEMFYTNIL